MLGTDSNSQRQETNSKSRIVFASYFFLFVGIGIYGKVKVQF